MEHSHSFERERADELVDDVLVSSQETNVHREAALKQRLADYEANADLNPDPLAAVLAFVASDLMQVTANIGEAIKSELSGGVKSIEDWQRVKGAMNDFFRGHRQFDRYASLERQMKESQSQAGHSSYSTRRDLPQASHPRRR